MFVGPCELARMDLPLKATRITHLGFVVQRKKRTYLRHAARNGYGRVVDEDLETFTRMSMGGGAPREQQGPRRPNSEWRYYEESPGEFEIPSDPEAFLLCDDAALWYTLRRSKNRWAAVASHPRHDVHAIGAEPEGPDLRAVDGVPAVVAQAVVDVSGPEAGGTVVAVLRAWGVQGNVELAVAAAERAAGRLARARWKTCSSRFRPNFVCNASSDR